MTDEKATHSTTSKRSASSVEEMLIHQRGARLVAVRNYFGHSQGTMATLLNVAVPTLKGYERGRGCPSCHAMERVAALGVDLHWLVMGVGNMFKTQAGTKFSPEERRKLFECMEEVQRVNETLCLRMTTSKLAGLALRLFSEALEPKESEGSDGPKDEASATSMARAEPLL